MSSDQIRSTPSEPKPITVTQKTWWYRLLRAALRVIALILLFSITLWSAAALYYDLPDARLRAPAAALYAAGVVAVSLFVKRRWVAGATVTLAFAIVLAWWLTLAPSNNRPWQGDVARTCWAAVNGEHLTIHNVRNFDYRTETDYIPHWETRTYDLSRLRGIDLFIIYWGSPAIAHVIVSFDFSNDEYLAFSIETRKEVGESYSTIGGFFRQYELVYIAADERDVVRVRTNYRQGENAYLFHTRATPERARAILLDYLKSANELRDHPQWYNALTGNCTTNIRVHALATANGQPDPWDWRLLLNGYSDELLYERGKLAGDLPFAELKQRAYINSAAQTADSASDFSRRIRVGRPGF